MVQPRGHAARPAWPPLTGNRPGTFLRPRVASDAGETSAQFDGCRELTAAIERGVDRRSPRFGDHEDRDSMGTRATADKL
jgi:hypothetical protein